MTDLRHGAPPNNKGAEDLEVKKDSRRAFQIIFDLEDKMAVKYWRVDGFRVVPAGKWGH